MRRIMLMAAALLLAGCGDSEDFSIDVAMAPDQAKAELARLDGGMALRALSLPMLAADQATHGELSFALPGDGDSGRLHLRFEEVGQSGARIHVALTMPAVPATIDGKRMVVDEDKAEAMIEERLEAWADGIRNNGYASLDPLNEALGGLTIALRPDTLNEVLAASADPEKLVELIDPDVLGDLEGAGDMDEAGYVEEASDLGEPMLDPESDIADASRPMDDAQGESPESDWADAGF